MSKKASRIRQIISRLKRPEDLAEIVKMAQAEVVRAIAFREPRRLDRGVAIYEAASEALGNARVRGQLPRYPQAA
jgi:biotin synthase-related radical SAM superfamily protein